MHSDEADLIKDFLELKEGEFLDYIVVLGNSEPEEIRDQIFKALDEIIQNSKQHLQR